MRAAKSLAAHRESTAQGVCEPKWPGTMLLAKDTVLLSEIVDQVFLVAIHPASNGEQEELQRMRHREATRPRCRHRIGP